MSLTSSSHCVVVDFVIEYAQVVSRGQKVPHNIFRKLWVCLHGEDASFAVETLNATGTASSQVLASIGHREDRVPVHLMQSLRPVSLAF